MVRQVCGGSGVRDHLPDSVGVTGVDDNATNSQAGGLTPGEGV